MYVTQMTNHSMNKHL